MNIRKRLSAVFSAFALIVVLGVMQILTVTAAAAPPGGD